MNDEKNEPQILDLAQFRRELPPPQDVEEDRPDGWNLYNVELLNEDHIQVEGMVAVTPHFVAIMGDPTEFRAIFPLHSVRSIIADSVLADYVDDQIDESTETA